MTIPVFGALVAGLIVLALPLVKRRIRRWRAIRREIRRKQTGEEIRSTLRSLGLARIWRAPMHQAEVMSFAGEMGEFSLRGELWDSASHDYFRLTLGFPKSLEQGLRVFTRERSWTVAPGKKRVSVGLGDRHFERHFHLLVHEARWELSAEIFEKALRDGLVELGAQVDDLEIGDQSLELLVEGKVSPSQIQWLLEDAIWVATRLYERAREVEREDFARERDQEDFSDGESRKEEGSSSSSCGGSPLA